MVLSAGKFFWFLLYTYLTQVYFTFFGESYNLPLAYQAYTHANVLHRLMPTVHPLDGCCCHAQCSSRVMLGYM